MDGVIILNTIEKVCYTPETERALIIFKAIGIVALMIYFGISIYVFFISLSADDLIGTISFICLVAVINCCIGYFITRSNSYTATYQQVLITDSIPIEDFTEKYQIIEQQGITYLVLEKGESE